jgi:hypothetical protein
MNAVLLVVAVGVALFALDRLGLWMERRGWIYYRHRKASPRTLGSAFLELQSMLEPGTRVLIEAREEELGAADASGEPPDAGSGPARDVD